jgi:DNA repair exonuclease SbcCD ATPase subunit
MSLIGGKNGVGKSCISEALTFALFGKPYRNINKPNLVNSINQKDCLTEIEFETGGKNYLVRRGIKPAIFEIHCDGKLINQDSKLKDYQSLFETQIIKMNYNTFTQLVFLGSASYVPFMQLTAADRRSIIEDMLDIGVFSSMSEILKKKISLLKEETLIAESEIKMESEKIRLQESFIKKNQQNKDLIIDSHQKTIDNSLAEIDVLNAEKSSILEEIGELETAFSKYDDLDSKKSEVSDIKTKASVEKNKLCKSKHFYDTNNNCSVCGQNIEKDFKEQILNNIEKQIQEYDVALGMAERKLSSLSKKMESKNEIMKEISGKHRKVVEIDSRISSENKTVKDCMSKISQAKSNFQDEENLEKDLSAYKQSLQTLENKKQSLKDMKSSYDVVSTLLKDSGIKSKIVKQYLPIINKNINTYLTAMDFFVNFNLDENFNEEIKSRHRDCFEYNSFSEGEKFRIDIALLLTWREIARIKNSTNTNILFLDEFLDSSLDHVGTEEVVKLLKALSQKINVLVISHKTDILADKFDNTIIVEKTNNFSRIK